MGQLRVSKSKPLRIGTCVMLTDAYWVQALEAVIHTGQRLGDDLITLQPVARPIDIFSVPADTLVDQILAHGLDALITSLTSLPLIEALVDEGLPVICLSEVDYHHPRFTSVSRLYEGGRLAAHYIGERLGGKGHALCVTAGLEAEHDTVLGQSRWEGFCNGMRAFPGITFEQVAAYWSHAEAYRVLLEAFRNYRRHVDAIFGISDTITLAARDARRELDIEDEVVLVGLNGDPLALAAVAEGSFSATVDIASEEMGATAAHVAHQAALGMPQPDQIQQRFQLITRENVASVATRKMIAIADIPSHLVGYSHQQQRDRLTQLEISMGVAQQIGSLQERDHVIQLVSEVVRQHYGYEWVRVLRWSQIEQKLVLYGGNPSPVSEQVPIEQDHLLNHAFSANQVVYIPDTRTCHRWKIDEEWKRIRSRVLLPIQLGHEVIGVLDLQSSQVMRWPSLEIVGLSLLAAQTGVAMRNSDLYLEALQAREAAERANQLKNRLVANVGHEMRSPLNAILGFSQTILRQIETARPIRPEELERDVQHIYKSGEHLMYMINDLLDLSRAEIGALSLHFEQIQPAPCLRDLFWSFAQAEPTQPGLSWLLEVPERLPTIRADVVRLRQIVANLLANARKYTHEGSITLGAAVEPPCLHIWVSDTGTGVPIGLQSKIFEPFGVAGMKRHPEGLGLGLSITRHLVALHGGTITLESQPGQGSTFHVYLPLPGIAQEPAVESPAEGEQVMLVVSTSSVLPEDLQEICARRNLKPKLVGEPEALNRALAQRMPSAIAWDLTRATPNEWFVISRLCGQKKVAALPIILYAGEDSGGQLHTGLMNVVFKPCNENTLKDWLGQIRTDGGAEKPILIVDDDPEARRFYGSILQTSHPEKSIVFAESGSQALEILQAQTPELMLLDLVMPGLDGFAVLERVRGDPRLQRVQVVIISGKLLNYEDIQRLNRAKTVVCTKGIFSEPELAAFLGRIETQEEPLQQPTSLVVKQSVAYLHQNYAQPITRKDIADAVGVSENYLSHIFRQEMAISPVDYLNRLRIHEAKALLLKTQETVTRIATLVGYNDPAYFSRVFRKLTHRSPQEFRKSVR